jgi:hypothetical protein
VIISKGADVFLTALAPTLMYDPALAVPFHAPLAILGINDSLNSAFAAELFARASDASALPFDLFVSPFGDFAAATANFTESGSMGVDAAIAQNFFLTPETASIALFALATVLFRWRVHNPRIAGTTPTPVGLDCVILR